MEARRQLGAGFRSSGWPRRLHSLGALRERRGAMNTEDEDESAGYELSRTGAGFHRRDSTDLRPDYTHIRILIARSTWHWESC
ncbi:MAG: hypothetical protein BroJett024_39400 [Alphaproteobacteria bacterium]|nr:MAG: hypothetical protein BroJett024_39400 [Alphaproteobacteria bacterium]